MNDRTHLLPPAALGLGLLGAVLRALQMRLGFEAETGLALQGSWINILCALFLAAAILAMLAPIWSPPAEKLSFTRCFAPLEGVLPSLLVAGAFLFLLSGGLYFFRYIQSGKTELDLVLGAFAACLTGSQLYALRRWRTDGTVAGLFLLPPVVFFLLSLVAAYLAHGTYPVTARYGIEILALAALAYGSYQVAATGYGQGVSRGLCRGLGLGIVLGFTAAATAVDLAECLTAAAGALTLLAYALSLQALSGEAPEDDGESAEA